MRFVSLELGIKIYMVHCLHSFLVQFCIHPTKLRINQHKQMITIQEYEFALCGSHVPTAAEADGHYWLFIYTGNVLQNQSTRFCLFCNIRLEALVKFIVKV